MKKQHITPAAAVALVEGDIKNFIAASTPGGIEAQEKAGQIEQSFLDTLPKDLRDPEAFKKLGFVISGPADDIFNHCTFPKGWRKSPTDHDMWTDILDEKGRKRGAIFYKAAFYDRSAHAHLATRFSVGVSYDDGPRRIFVRDEMGAVKKEIGGLLVPNWNEDREEARRRSDKIDQAKKELSRWLDANYPGWESPINHWEE